MDEATLDRLTRIAVEAAHGLPVVTQSEYEPMRAAVVAILAELRCPVCGVAPADVETS